MQLTPIQRQMESNIYDAWASGSKNVMAVLPTGSGKTVLFSKIAGDNQGPTAMVAHRQELVGQISLAAAIRGIHHKIIGPKNVVRYIVRLHMTELGRCFYDSDSPMAVAGVDTLMSTPRREALREWCNSVTLWIMDEGHHITQANKWGKAVDYSQMLEGWRYRHHPPVRMVEGLGGTLMGL